VRIAEQSVCFDPNDNSGPKLCKIGMTGPGGGIVFFIDNFDQYPSFCPETGRDCNYLEASPADATVGLTQTFSWCSNTNLLGLNDWGRRAIGAGRTNTVRMLDATQDPHCVSGAAVIANEYSTAQTAEGSWWLPSLGELMVMYSNLTFSGVGDFTYLLYWSSSERSSLEVWTQRFQDGYQSANFKNDGYRVRPVRAF
jgi:hypothetical protein